MSRPRTGWAQRLLPPLVPAAVLIVAAELLVRTGVILDFLVPRPSAVAAAFVRQADSLLLDSWNTARAAIAGFLIAAVVGIGLAIVLSSARWIQRAFYPYAIFLQTVPIVAIAPLLVIWFGNDITAVIASAAIVSVFPIIANTLAGLLSTDPALLDLFKLYRASSAASLFKLRLPFALPGIFTGLRIGAGLSVIGAIVGELVTTGSGLGGRIMIARQQQQIELVFAALILSAAVGLAMFLAINLLTHFALRHWHASEKT